MIYELDSYRRGQGQLVHLHEEGNENSDFMECEEFLSLLNNQSFLRLGFSLLSYLVITLTRNMQSGGYTTHMRCVL